MKQSYEKLRLGRFLKALFVATLVITHKLVHKKDHKKHQSLFLLSFALKLAAVNV